MKIFENESVRAREIFCLGLTVADEEEEEEEGPNDFEPSVFSWKSEKSALSGRGDVSSFQ